MAEFIQVMTTIDSKEGAQKIAETLVAKRLAACVQVAGPITSTYWWQGEMEIAQEWLCIAKTRHELYERVERAIGEIHPYDTPEIVVLPLITGNKRYLDWIIGETTK
jgi:periplasmic divalent cation tolerance protein